MIYIPNFLKHCSKCHEIKLLNVQSFPRDKRKRDGFCSACLVCYCISSRLYRKNSPDAAKNATIRYRSKNSERIREKNLKWQKENRDKVRIIERRSNQKHPDRSLIKNQRRRALRRNLPYTLTVSDWEYGLDYFGGCCAVCGRPRGLWHVIVADHWIPLASPDCPGTVPTNIVPMCHALTGGVDACNNLKGNRDPREWLISKLGPTRGNAKLAEIEAYFCSLDK